MRKFASIITFVSDNSSRSVWNSHVKGHVVRDAVLVGVCDVMNGTNSHDDLASSINNGQVNNSPAQKKGEFSSQTLKHLQSINTVCRNLLELAQPWVCYDGSKDRGQVAKGHKGVVDSGGKVIVPPQKVLEVQHQYSCSTVHWSWHLCPNIQVILCSDVQHT